MHENAFHYRVLIVDDEAKLRQLNKHVLESQGYEVHCAGDGFEGLTALKNAPPDMIISDLQMPNMNGFEFLAVVRQRFPATPLSSSPGSSPAFRFQKASWLTLSFRKAGISPPNYSGKSRTCSIKTFQVATKL